MRNTSPAHELRRSRTVRCLTTTAAARQGDPATLADDVSGLFFLDPDGPVRVQGLSTRNHPADGIAAWGASSVRVYKTAGYGHGRYGVLAAASAHTRISRTIEQGV